MLRNAWAQRACPPLLSESLGQPVIIDNRGGTAGTIGSEQLARALADGYTLLWGTPGTHGIAPRNVARKERSVFRGAMVTLRNAFVQAKMLAHLDRCRC